MFNISGMTSSTVSHN